MKHNMCIDKGNIVRLFGLGVGCAGLLLIMAAPFPPLFFLFFFVKNKI